MKKISTILSLILLSICSNPSSVAGEGTSVPRSPSTLIKTGETIAFLGDSITAGGASYGGYCRLVVHGLKAKGIRVKAIYAGVPGNKSSDMLLRLDGILRQKPDHLFLSVGVNDVWHTDPTAKIGVFQPKPGMGVQLEHFKIYVPQILDKCKAVGTKVIMSTFTQITENPQHRLNKKAKAYNDFLRRLAKERSLPLADLDKAAWAKIAGIKLFNSEYNNRNAISSDGIHPTAIGHQTMALGVLKALGLTEADLAVLEKEWKSCPQIMAIGDRQVFSGTRPGGWRVMLLDCLNSGREMVLNRAVVAKPATLGGLVPKVRTSVDSRTKYLLFVPPMGDVTKKTPLNEYGKAVDALVELAKSKNLQLVISTYAIVGPDPNSKINAGAESLNRVLREACKKAKIPLVDIATIMRDYQKKNPGAKLNFGDERFNHTSGKLMTEAVFKALGGDDKILPELRRVWDSQSSYPFRYEQRVTVDVNLSEQGRAALSEISDRYHKLGADKMLELGVHLLLNSPKGTNDEAVRYADQNWISKEPAEKPLTLRRHPDSVDEAHAFQAYAKKEGIDMKTFYMRAFKVGLNAVRTTNILGRGKME